MSKRALVLGGGGPVGIAWEAGVLLGLAEEGVDLAAVDRVIGTSAGAFVGARIALGHSPGDIAAPYARREPRTSEPPAPSSTKAPTAPADVPDLGFLFQAIQEASRAGHGPAEITRRIGAFALESRTMSEEEFAARFSSKLRQDGAGAWPSRSFICTAFDAQDGSFMLWDAGGGADLTRAVASSCAVPGVYPPITIGGRRYYDGGVLSTTNAHLARGFDRVVVLAVTELLMRYADMSRAKKTPLDRETNALREAGARVEVVALDMQTLQAVGPNLMDHRRQPVALEEGIRQGRAEAERVVEAMRG